MYIKFLFFFSFFLLALSVYADVSEKPPFYTSPLYSHLHQYTGSWENENHQKSENVWGDEKNALLWNRVSFHYHPKQFHDEIHDYIDALKAIIWAPQVYGVIDTLPFHFHKSVFDETGVKRRGKIQNGEISFFGVNEMQKNEFSAVGIHEIAHYIDLFFLKYVNGEDLSNRFYVLSWESVDTIVPWWKPEDFVSWYAMTNQYEDFAESFTYYVLHNKDFLFKAESSEILQKKYDFFSEHLLNFSSSIHTDFSDEDVEYYYWDITKIDYNLKKF